MQEDKNTHKDQRKKELTDKVAYLAKTVKESRKPRTMEETIEFIEHAMYMANINTLKGFLIDRNCQGEKPRFMVSSPVVNDETGITEDRWYLPINGPGGEYYQEMLDMLKNQQFIPDDSTIEDYDFLFYQEGAIEQIRSG